MHRGTRHPLLRAGFWAALALTLLALPVRGQDLTDIVVVCEDTDPDPDVDTCSIHTDAGFDVFPTLDEAVAEAKSRHASTGRHITVLVTAGTWTTSGVTIEAGDDIEIKGNENDPQQVIIDGAGGSNVFDLIDGAGGDGEERIILEGLTIRGGKSGVLVDMTPDEVGSVVIARCFIRANSEHGVRVEGESTPIIVNCSIRLNSGDGVHAADQSAPQVIFCTLWGNGGSGVLFGGAGGLALNTIAFQNGAGFSGSGSAGFNNAFDNPPGVNDQNYVGMASVTDPFPEGIDPEFVGGTPWGELEVTSPMIGQATPNSAGGFGTVDFQNGGRDIFTPDIGADEQGATVSIGPWYYCQVNFTRVPDTSPVPGAFEYEFAVDVRTRSGAPDSAFIMTQGGDPDVLAHRIPLAETFRSEGAGIWVGQTTGPVRTVIVDNDLNDVQSQGDILADGHAYVCIVAGGTIFGDDFTFPWNEGGFIQEPAVVTRHFLIDTQAPRMLFTDPMFGDGASQFVALLTTPGPYGAMAVPATAAHPYYPANLLALLDYAPAFLGVPPAIPVDDGLIRPRLPGSQEARSIGAQVFSNVSSLSNFYDAVYAQPSPLPPQQALDVVLRARFVDLPPLDASLNPIAGITPGNTNRDHYTNLTNRQVGGFIGAPTLPTLRGTVQEILEEGPFVRWIFGQGRNLVQGLAVEVSHVVPVPGSGANPGFDFANAGQGLVDPENASVEASWRFFDGDPLGAIGDGIPGIPYVRAAANQPFHFSTQFYAIDTQEVRPVIDTRDPLLLSGVPDPLHVWWLLDVETEINPSGDGADYPENGLTWKVNREPSYAAGTLRPRFVYRAWQSALPGKSLNALNAVYVPIPGFNWSPWPSAANVQTSLPGPDFFRKQFGIEGRYILLVVAAADEAGNVERLPIMNPIRDLLYDSGADTIQVVNTAGKRANWVRKYIPGAEETLDTQVTATFWHNNLTEGDITLFEPSPPQNEVTFGAATVLPAPGDQVQFRLEGRFAVTVISPSADDVFGPLLYRWDLLRDGVVVLRSEDTGTPFIPFNRRDLFYLPGPFFDRLDDLNMNRPIRYVLTVMTFRDGDGPRENVFDPDDEPFDPTPATISFTVVPRGVGAFVDPANAAGNQPIKVQENR